MLETIRNIFVNPTEKRARMLWRLLGQVLLLLLLIALAECVLSALHISSFSNNSLDMALFSLKWLLAFVISIWIAARFLDRRPLADFGLRLDAVWWCDLGFGLFLGAFLMLLIFLVELAFGWITITDTFYVADGGAFGPAILVFLVRFLAVGIYEEMFSRGYHMTNFAQGFRKLLGPRGGLIVGWILSSVIFGKMHWNPRATVTNIMNIGIGSMFLFGIGYLLTGRLGISIGVHITWNFFESRVFGFPASGMSANNATFIAVEQGGNDLLTGGAFGPAAGLVGLAATFVGAGLIVLWVRWHEGSVGLYLPMTDPRKV
jgi:membrane protease YdiL (CAAX protease family)